jgi:hypothetical protein
MATMSGGAWQASNGAAEFITKPVDFDLLKTQLRDLSDAAD